MTNPIMPSVGRIVLIRLPGSEEDVPGIVTKVHSQDCINATVFPDNGLAADPRTSILYAEDHAASGQDISWHWMDYQVKVAAERDAITGEPTETSESQATS